MPSLLAQSPGAASVLSQGASSPAPRSPKPAQGGMRIGVKGMLPTNKALSSDPWWVSKFQISPQAFITAAWNNLSIARTRGCWTLQTDPTTASGLDLGPGEAFFVDTVATFQFAAGVAVTGSLDKRTQELMQGHMVAGTYIGDALRACLQWGLSPGSRGALVAGHPVQAPVVEPQWLDTARAKALADLRAASGRAPSYPSTANLRSVVVPISTVARLKATTRIKGLPLYALVNAALYNALVACQLPGMGLPGVGQDADKVGIAVKASNSEGITGMTSAKIPLLIAAWEAMRNYPITGRLSPNNIVAMVKEASAKTDWGVRFLGLFDFSRPIQRIRQLTPTRTATSSEVASRAQHGIKGDGVVSNLQPKLIAAQASNTEARRQENQAVRDQYQQVGSNAQQDVAVLTDQTQQVRNDAEADARVVTAETAGRTGFVDPNLAASESDPTFSRGGGLLATADGGTMPPAAGDGQTPSAPPVVGTDLPLEALEKAVDSGQISTGITGCIG